MRKNSFMGPYGRITCISHPCVDKRCRYLVIMTHGFRGSRDAGGRATVLARKLSDLCTVIRFNFSGSQFLSEEVEELKAVIQQVRKRYAPEKLFLLGRSLGGAAALLTASEDTAIAGLILVSTPNNLRETFRQVLGTEQYSALNRGVPVSLSDARGNLTLLPKFLTDFDHYDIENALGKWQRPLLILHGGADAIVSFSQAQKNFALAGGTKEIHIFPNAVHSLEPYSEEADNIIYHWLIEQFNSGK